MSDFLLHRHTEKHLAISTSAGYQMAIASTLRATSGTEVGRNPALKSLLRNIEMEQGQHRGEIHAFEHARLQRTTGWTQVTLRVGLSFISKTQVLGKGSKCVLSCTIPALDRHLSNGMAEDRLLPNMGTNMLPRKVHALEEHKRLLFVSFKPGHRRDIVPSTISGWIRKTILECYAHSPTPLLESHKAKAHQLRSMAASLAFHRQASMEHILRAGTWPCYNTFTDFYLKYLWSRDMWDLCF